MVELSKPLNAAKVLSKKPAYISDSNPRGSFVDEIRSYGFQKVPATPVIGKVERIVAPDDKKGKQSGWYFYNEIPDDYQPGAFIGIGVFGSWKNNPERVVWSSKRKDAMSSAEAARFEEQLKAEKMAREEELKQRRAEAAEKAKSIWKDATTAPDEHPYLAGKDVHGHGVKVSRGKIIVPVKENDELVSLQFIDTHGGKKFLGGGKTKGCSFRIEGKYDVVYVCEGFATGATLHEVTFATVYVAFNAGNLLEVTSAAKDAHPDSEIVIAGDDDHSTDGNPGRSKAAAAGDVMRCKVIFPEVEGDDTDFNDMARAKGEEAVKDRIASQLAAPGVSLFGGEPLDLLSKFNPMEFPVEILPPVLRDVTREQSELIGSDPAIFALSALVVCASAISDKLKIQPKQLDSTYTDSARLWGAIMGPPSTRKTPAIGKAMGPVKAMQVQWTQKDAPLLAEFVLKEKIYKARETAYVKRQANKTPETKNTPPDKPEKPPSRRTYVEDITVEALSGVLADNDRGILTYADELSGFFGSFGAYNPGKASKDRAHYLELWNGGPRQVDRVGSGSTLVPNWGSCLLGGIQPEPMRKIANKIEDDGLLQRFLPVICRDAKMEIDRRPDMDAINAYKNLVQTLYWYEPPDEPLKLSADAQVIRKKFLEFATQAGVLGALSPKLGAHLGKYGGIFERMLLVFHVVESLGAGTCVPNTISEQTAAIVSDLMRKFFFSHAAAFYLDILGDTPDHTAAQAVAGYILASGASEITNRMLQANVRQLREFNQRERQRIMDTLTMSSWVAPVESNKPSGPTKWTVNPRVHELFKARADQERKKRDTAKEAIKATVRDIQGIYVDDVDGDFDPK